MSNVRTNKTMKKIGNFPTRTPKQLDFTGYVYSFADGTQTVISRSELSSEVDELMNVIKKLEMDVLREAIQSLQPQQQQLIFKKYTQGKSNICIAREEGVTEGAIRDRLVKINKQLKKKLQEKI